MANWKKIDKGSLGRLERHYLQFEPYCHLNVVDLWSYRAGPNHWFEVGDTFVYRLNDYMDDSLYITLLGKTSVRQAVKEVAKKENSHGRLTLRCVPQTAMDFLHGWDAVVSHSEDPDNHDYVFDVESFLDLSSPELKNKFRAHRKFARRYPKVHVRALDHNKAYDRRLMYGMFRKWVRQTKSQEWHKEFRALKRALNFKERELVCVGFFDGRKMIGYTVNEPEPNGYYQAFFGKADRGYGNLGFFMEYETARYIHKRYGSKFMNLQPDSGLEGLRLYKTSLGPQRMLKKYSVVIDTAKALA